MNKEGVRLIVPADWQLQEPEFYRDHIWRPAWDFGIPRRLWLDALTLIYAYDGHIFWQSGRVFELPDIDNVFADPENRWMSGFLAVDSSGQVPKRICRALPKLRLIALYVQARRLEDRAAARLLPASLP